MYPDSYKIMTDPDGTKAYESRSGSTTLLMVLCVPWRSGTESKSKPINPAPDPIGTGTVKSCNFVRVLA
jgi:hypothetical protein